MQDLIKQEQFELDVLNKLNSGRLLNHLVMVGGTMLRLCFGLERFSLGMDFWIVKDVNTDKLFKALKENLSTDYILKDCADKYYTLLFEIQSVHYPRSLKIEIRKKKKKIDVEQAIAYSPYSNVQVLLRVISLENMMREKVRAFLERKEIRDVFDMEFLLKKGIDLDCSTDVLKKLLKEIDALNKKDYTVKLGSILEESLRTYYISENFKILKTAIKDGISQNSLSPS